MIIKRIQATNILRYSRLQLDHLPGKGLIGISGANESGKTTIAELVCLALFGRTFALEPSEIAKVVKWGEFSGHVQLEFATKDGYAYEVRREIDLDGNQTARITRSGEEIPLARGLESVRHTVVELGGFSYKRFIDSFYLPQRVLSSPDALAETSHALTGVDTLEHIGDEIERELQTLESELAPLARRIEEDEAQLGDLDIQEDALSQLLARRQTQADTVAQHEAQATDRTSTASTVRSALERLKAAAGALVRRDVSTSAAEWDAATGRLDTALAGMNDAGRLAGKKDGLATGVERWVESFRRRLQAFDEIAHLTDLHRKLLAWLSGTGARPPTASPEHTRTLPEQTEQVRSRSRNYGRSRNLAASVALITLIVVLGGWGILWFLHHASEHAFTQWLASVGIGTHPSHRTVLLLIAVGASAVCFVFLVRTFHLASRILESKNAVDRIGQTHRGVERQAKAIDASVSVPIPQRVAMLRQVDDERLASALAEFAGDQGAPLLDAKASGQTMAELDSEVQASADEARRWVDELEAQHAEAQPRLDRLRQQLQTLNGEVVAEEVRREKAQQLTRQVEALKQRRAADARAVEVRGLATRLLQGTHRRLYGRFNLEMRYVVGKIMPIMTGGRYQSLQFDDNLHIQVLSSEKGNFVGLNEISGGAYHQVLLAVRLALSQALIASSIGGAEFVILDEPFVFFDAERTHETLAALPKISHDMAQTWVIAQEFADDSMFDLHIVCDRASDELIVTGA